MSTTQGYLIASELGLYTVNNKVISEIKLINLPSSHITSMISVNQQIWIGTLNNGLHIIEFTDNHWKLIKTLTKSDSLPEDTIKALSLDNKNRVWVSGRNSIYVVDPKTHEIIRQTNYFHWLNMEFHDNGTNQLPSDLIMFTGNEGLIFFDPDKLIEQKSFPEIRLTSIQIMDKLFNQTVKNNMIVINHLDTFYSFNISALEFLSPELIEYQYQLSPGLNKWQSFSNGQINLSRLPYDLYSLEIKATNSDKVFGEKTLNVQLNVKAPFWWTIWAKLLYSITLLGVIAYLIISNRNRLIRMTKLAKHDGLTKLPNRHYFVCILIKKMALALKHDYKIAVIFFDLNGFKAINDNYGHDVGDRLLQHVANCVSNCIRENDFFARQSGDEFVLVLDTIHQLQDISNAINRIQLAFEQEFIHADEAISYGCSIGISIFDKSNTVLPEDLIKQADTAMYQCKQTKAEYCYFEYQR